MKLKKLFAGIVAVAMMATMAAPAFAESSAASVVPSEPDDSKVSIEKVITGTGYGSETVRLEVEENGKAVLVKHSSYTTANAPAISVGEAGGVIINETTDGGRGTLHIKLPTYDRVGTYVYKFKEVAGKTAGMTYDTNSKWLVVNVYNDVNSDGEFADGSALKVNAVVLNADPTNALNTDGNLSSMSEKKIDHIDNEYNAGTYTVKKLVKGNMSDRQKEFNFKVTFENTTTDKTTIPTMKVDGKDFGTNGIETLTWTGNKATYDFTLSHGKTATFTNVPYGMKVSVVELDDNKAALTGNTNGEYAVEYNTDANGVKLGSDETKGEKPSGAAEITNTSTVNVNTGVILDNAPYIALLTIVAAGAVVMIMKKRRNYED